MPCSKVSYFSGALPAEDLLDEKSKKAGTHGACLGDVQRELDTRAIYDIRVVLGAPTPTVIFHYAPIGYLQHCDLVPRSESVGTQEIVPCSPRGIISTSSPQPSGPVMPGRIKNESTVQDEGCVGRDDVKPPCTSTHLKKRTILEVKIEVSDTSDVGELSPEDQLAYARIKAQLANVRAARAKKRVKVEHDVKPEQSGEVIVLSD